MPNEPAAPRLVSLDAFRGATMMLMVLVNSPGDGNHTYGPLQHAEWHGWTPTDVVFPSFLWIVGVAITLSLSKRLAAGTPRSELISQILRRGAILFVLGLVIYIYPTFSLTYQRIPGVLQRIAICYVIASIIYLTSSIRVQLIWTAALLAIYWALMMLVPVPGYGAGRLDVEGNFAHYVDKIVLGTHNYVQTKTWDPEGIISTLPSIATALLGIMAGHLLRLNRPLAERLRWMLLTGVFLIAAGQVASIWLPINKKLWTSSFSLFMAGLDFVMLAAFAWLIDMRGYQRAVKPLVIMGSNAIAIYMASELGDEFLSFFHLREPLYKHTFTWITPAVNASLAYAVAYTAAMYAIAHWMYRRNWYIKV
ncbi:MAG: DUF5009 domain-containing protein [Acidobacteria bacterium]|nr:DUF5009 domain-containing protein [Acidobacteriota bacterium]